MYVSELCVKEQQKQDTSFWDSPFKGQCLYESQVPTAQLTGGCSRNERMYWVSPTAMTVSGKECFCVLTGSSF